MLSPYINQIIERSYNGTGWDLLTNAMAGRDFTPVEIYFYKARDLILKLFLALVVFSMTCLAGIHQRHNIKDIFNSDTGRSIAFLLIWLFLPLSFYVIFSSTANIPSHYMYLSLVPFSAILSIILVKGLQSILSSGHSIRSLILSPSVISLLIIVGLLFSFLVYSPFVKEYKWIKDRNYISSIFLKRILEVASKLPNDARINIQIHLSEHPGPDVGELEFYSYVIKSWLDLNLPNNQMEVFIPKKTTRLKICTGNLDFRTKIGENNNVMIDVIQECLPS